MRKKTIKFCFDTLLWGIIILLPLILYFLFIVFYLHGERSVDNLLYVAESTSLSFENVMNYVFGWFDNYGLDESGIIYSTLYTLFDSGSFLPYIDGDDYSAVLWYAQYIILVELLHLCVDFIAFLPRICRKFFDKYKSEEC